MARYEDGCGNATGDVSVTLTWAEVKVPELFTPNGDGYYDLFGLVDSDYCDGMVLYIYDRFGKLLKTLKQYEFWDGLYDGKRLPTTDYWYVLELKQAEKSYTGHFTLGH